MKRTAYSIHRTGHARLRGEHLQAANQACMHCTNVCEQGRLCPHSYKAGRETMRLIWRAFGPYVLAVLAAVAMAAAPALLDGVTPQIEASP